jgi:N6-adenosine-specific RNA methylase IME4
MGTQCPSIIEAPVGKHSEMPEKFLEMIEAYFPTMPKIELFRRGKPRSDWDAWEWE